MSKIFPLLSHIPHFGGYTAPGGHQFYFGSCFSMAENDDKDKAKDDSNVVVPDTEGSRSEDRHHLQASTILDDDERNTHISILFSIFRVQTFSNHLHLAFRLRNISFCNSCYLTRVSTGL